MRQRRATRQHRRAMYERRDNSPSRRGHPSRSHGGWRGRVQDMDHISGIFTFKNDAYVIPIHRVMFHCSVVNDVCRRWTLVKEQVELKCHILEMSNFVMKLLNGEDIDRIIDMHEIIGQKMIKIDVHVSGSEEIVTFRACGEQSSGKMASLSQSPMSPPPMSCMRGHGYCIMVSVSHVFFLLLTLLVDLVHDNSM
ncbi:hypothetical protein Taro_042287 [Colocasia esculenta]|uniref:Uncharacterized protein n=1 Tax=Colocasia esculenta TaxID=4460 RepID=A0A843WY64_COLES|nr:hypothetical protein [Colocasia esculenta]